MCFCFLGDLGTLSSNLGLKMVSWRPRRYLKTFLEPVASFSLSMASSTLTATPIVPENMLTNMQNMYGNIRKCAEMSETPVTRLIINQIDQSTLKIPLMPLE